MKEMTNNIRNNMKTGSRNEEKAERNFFWELYQIRFNRLSSVIKLPITLNC